MSNFEDVRAFHQKFGFPAPECPTLLDPKYAEFRVKFLLEELQEIATGMDQGNLTEVFDGLLDIVYVAMGTAVAMGLPWQEGWDEVQRSNMTKVRGTGKRGQSADCIKPEGWEPPNLRRILLKYYLTQSGAANGTNGIPG